MPAVVLGLFWRACEEVVALPARLRAIPRDAVVALGRARGARAAGGGARRRGARGGCSVLSHSARELLTPYAPLVALFSPPFLVATGLAAVATALEALAALVVLAA